MDTSVADPKQKSRIWFQIRKLVLDPDLDLNPDPNPDLNPNLNPKVKLDLNSGFRSKSETGQIFFSQPHLQT
jgi:hypothetical protein